MARSTTLSDEAFRALREEKRPGESDSDVVLRLRREARARRGDPTRFLRARHVPARPWASHVRTLARMRARSARDAWTDR